MVIKLKELSDKEKKESFELGEKLRHAFTLAQHNAYLKSKAKEEKPKDSKKVLKKDIIKFGRKVKDTYIFKKDFSPELNYMK